MNTPPEFREILQQRAVVAPWRMESTNRLPGLAPMEMRELFWRDEAYDDQMAYRDWLFANKRDAVFAQSNPSFEAQEEYLSLVCDHLRSDDGYQFDGSEITRPDGVTVTKADPLLTAGRLLQQDICLLEQNGDEHSMTAAVLCFPASWSLSEKIGQPLSTIHEPVDEYDTNIEKRVQRVFDALQPGRAVWRVNYLEYVDADLHQPRRMDARRNRNAAMNYSRLERQTLLKLPQSKAVIFGIHSIVMKGSLKTHELGENSL